MGSLPLAVYATRVPPGSPRVAAGFGQLVFVRRHGRAAPPTCSTCGGKRVREELSHHCARCIGQSCAITHLRDCRYVISNILLRYLDCVRVVCLRAQPHRGGTAPLPTHTCLLTGDRSFPNRRKCADPGFDFRKIVQTRRRLAFQGDDFCSA